MALALLQIVLTLWGIAGAILAAVFYSERILPAKKQYKTIVAIGICGPIAWIAIPIIKYCICLSNWLKK